MIRVRAGCGGPRLLSRFPLRNLLINGVVYVSARTFLCQEGKRWRFGVKDAGWRGSRGQEEVTQLNAGAIKMK